MCRNCGAIIGAGENACAVCKQPVTQPRAEQSRPTVDRETLRFARAVLDRPYKYTTLLLMLNFFVFLLMWESSGLSWQNLWVFPDHVLLAYGAKLNSLIDEQHQWWRFVTPMFVHVNLPHIMVNMYSLWMVGPYVEKLYGSAKFIVFWVLTGIAGVVASYLTVIDGPPPLGTLGRFIFKTHDVPSAGASGALFGLVGVLFVFGIKFRHELPEGFKRAFGTGMLPIIFINLFIGFLGRGFIDNAAHLGGLLSGAALAATVQYRRPGERPGITASWYVLQALAVLLVVISFFKVVQHFNDQPLGAQPAATTSSEKSDLFLSYWIAVSDAQETLNYALDGDLTRVDQSIKNLDSVANADPEAEKLRVRLKELLVKAKNAAVPAASPAVKGKKTEAKPEDLRSEVDAWKKDYEAWLKKLGS
jgi:rhomboid protease GluP